MSDFDLERLGDVWRQRPDPAELEELKRTAAVVRRRARFGQVVDIGAAVAVASIVIFLVASNPRIETVSMGSAAILVLLSSNLRLRRLRKVELKGLAGSTEEMLDQSIERVENILKYNRFTLIALGPVILLGFLFSSMTSADSIPAVLDVPTFRLLWLGAGIAVLAGLALFPIVAIRRGRRELERLTAMRESYRQEREFTM